MKVKRNKIYTILILIFIIPETFALANIEGYTINAQWISNVFFQNMISIIYLLRNVMAVIACSIYIIFGFKNKNFRKLKKRILIVDLYWVFVCWIFLSSAMNNIDLYTVFRDLIVVLGFASIVLILIQKDFINTVDIIYNLLIKLLFLNLLLIVIYPNGILNAQDIYKTKFYLIASKNQATPMLILTAFLNTFKISNKKSSYIEMIIIIANALLMGSTTGSAVILIIYSFYLIGKIWKSVGIRFSIDFNRILIVGLIVASLVVIFGNVGNQFTWLMSNVLGKNDTISSRSMIWGRAIKQIIQKPFIGYGYGHYVFGHYYGHNMILELLLISGLIGFIIYFVMFYIVIEKASESRKYDAKLFFAAVVLVLVNTFESFALNIYQVVLLELIMYYSTASNQKIQMSKKEQ